MMITHINKREEKSSIKRITEEMMASIVQAGSWYPTLNRIASVEKVCYIKHERVFVQFGLHSIPNGPCFLSNDGGIFGKVYFVLCYFCYFDVWFFILPFVTPICKTYCECNEASHGGIKKYLLTQIQASNTEHWALNIEHPTLNIKLTRNLTTLLIGAK